MEDARQRATRWIEEAPSFIEMVEQVVDDRQRALVAIADTERQCAQLREELATVRAQCDDLKRDRSETGAMLAEALGRAGEALMRLRPTTDIRVAPLHPAPPVSVGPAPLTLAEPAAEMTAPTPEVAEPVAEVASLVAEMAAPALEMARPALETAEPPAESVEPATRRRVLLVDDDQNFRNVMTEYLEGIREYDVRAAASGEEGLSILAHDQPDIVLLDLMMPGMGGMAALQSMKALYPSLCVVMVTANEDLTLARKALALGAADYVTKPFDLDYLDAVLNMYLTKDESTPEPPAAGTGEPSPDGGRASEVTAYAAIDGPGPVAFAARSLRSYFTRR